MPSCRHAVADNAGVRFLELCHTVPTTASADHYTRVVVEHSYRRGIQTAALRLLRAAEHAPLDAPSPSRSRPSGQAPSDTATEGGMISR